MGISPHLTHVLFAGVLRTV